jgi:hypothetical protein
MRIAHDWLALATLKKNPQHHHLTRMRRHRRLTAVVILGSIKPNGSVREYHC